MDEDDIQDVEEVDSDEENMENGKFLEYMSMFSRKAMKERKYLLNELKAKERRGCIFFDKVNKIVAAIQKGEGKYDYVVEWKFNA